MTLYDCKNVLPLLPALIPKGEGERFEVKALLKW